jgi:tripartite-type tricarboxylate transporter receptor subunit TctC
MSGNGTSAHLAGELLNYMAKAKIQSIPYKGKDLDPVEPEKHCCFNKL